MAVTRDVFLSREHAGPASPLVGCMPQTWDPIEDALALGWPKLPARTTAVGERWTGLRVAAKCNRSACVDPTNGRGGPENHHRSCATQDWQNTLAGVYEHQGQRLALIQSTWTDGHGEAEPSNTLGLWSERTTLVSIDEGRPLWSTFILHHNFATPTVEQPWQGVERRWTMTAIDACDGGLADLGWTRPEQTLEPALRFAQLLHDAKPPRTRDGRAPFSGPFGSSE